MTKRRVGIEITAQCIRMAIFNGEKENPTLERLVEHAIDDSSPIGELLLEMLDSRPGFADRFCSTLPTTSGFVRRLSFPFSDTRKIDAAARMELAAQLPTDISEHIVVTTPPQADAQGGFITTAVTAKTEQIEAALQPFEAVKLPLHVLGLSPYTEACGLHNWFSDGLLVQVHEQQLLISLLQQGQVISFEACGNVGNNSDTLAARIAREAAMICRSARLPHQKLCLIGNGVSPALNKALAGRGLELVELPLRDNSQAVEPAFLPVCARALAADQPMVNFRRGPFTLKSEWASLKKHLYIGGALMLAALIIAGGTAIHTYRHKTDVAEGYRKQMTQLFRQTLPETRAIVNIPMQLQVAVQQLKETSQLVGLDKSTSALSVLREFSAHTPADLKVDIKNFNYEDQSLVVDGVTNSFDSVNRLTGELRKSPIFGEVRIADAKTGLDGQQISFRLQITIGQQGGQQ
ncbi:MAG: PilN domain-containing protein [Desulfuromonas sp.]|nr:PilN domain-containing protein [Desulfuromonas sp.]